MRLSTAKLAIAFAASCVTFAQSTDNSYMPGVDFSKYHTYKWVSVRNRQHPDSIQDLRIRELVDSQLAAKGLVKIEDMADLDVDYQVALNKAVTWEKYQDFELGTVPKQQMTIDTGTFVLDMYDAASKRLVWTGRARRFIDPKGGSEQKRQRVKKAIEAMLAHFPPK